MLVSRRLAWISTEYFKSSGNVKEKPQLPDRKPKLFECSQERIASSANADFTGLRPDTIGTSAQTRFSSITPINQRETARKLGVSLNPPTEKEEVIKFTVVNIILF